MAEMDNHMWRNVLLAGARGLEFTFAAIAKALSGEEPVEASGFSQGHYPEPSQSKMTGGRGKREKKEKKEKRAPNAYNLFVAEQVKLLREAYPDIPHTEIFKRVAADWKYSTKNKKNVGADSAAPPPAAEAPKAAAAAAAAHVDEEEEEEGEEVTGGGGEIATQEFVATQEKAEKKEKKKKKKERREHDAGYEGGAMEVYQANDAEQATPEKRLKKSKR